MLTTRPAVALRRQEVRLPKAENLRVIRQVAAGQAH